MDKHQQVFWTDINLRHKNKCQKKTINTNGIICLRQNSKIPFHLVPILHGEQQNGKKNLKLVFHLSVSPTTIHVVKLIPRLTSKHNDDKQTKMVTLMPFDDRRSRYGETHVISFVFTRQNQKFLHDTRETSLLTALLFSQFVLSSCLRTAHTERLCC